MISTRFTDLLTQGIKNNWNKNALSNYNGNTYTYGDIAKEIENIRLIYSAANLQKGDKIALAGKNSVNWAIVYLATVMSELVIVPILADFKAEAVEHIINHSESKLLFVSEHIKKDINTENIPAVEGILSIEKLNVVATKNQKIKNACLNRKDFFNNKYPEGLTPDTFNPILVDNNKLAVISYTSGTSGLSKGVMLSHNSLAANMKYAHENMPLVSGDKIVSFLPLAHAFGCAFEFLFPFTLGCHITFLTKTPSPQIVVEAFKKIRPRLILSVPLVIEKIYKKQIAPMLKKPGIQVMAKIPGINKILFSIIRKKLFGVFGGNFTEIVIGGAALSHETERFFHKIKFPFTVGYGMTECGPLVSYSKWNKFKPESAGKTITYLDARIDSYDQQNVVGEIMVRGENVMSGYYKNPKATSEVLDDAGWLHTGDLGTIDNDGIIFIKGRAKNMILGPSGQNIYPEEVESEIANNQLVLECVIKEENGKIIAMVVPDKELMKKRNFKEANLPRIFEYYRKETNKKLPAYAKVSKYEIRNEEFEKTPKRSIKRYLYA